MASLTESDKLARAHGTHFGDLVDEVQSEKERAPVRLDQGVDDKDAVFEKSERFSS